MGSIRLKLVSGFVILFLTFAAGVVVQGYYLRSSEQLVTRSINEDFNTSLAISSMAVEGQKLRRFEKELFIYANSPERRTAYFREWTDSFRNLENMIQTARADTSGAWTPADRKNLETWAASLETYGKGFRGVAINLETGNIKGTLAANEAVADAKNAFKVFLEGTEKGGAAKLDSAKLAAAEISRNFGVLNKIVFGTAIMGLLVMFAIILFVPAAIIDPIDDLTRAAAAMGKGNLSVQIPAIRTREFTILRDTLESLRLSQREMIQQLKARPVGG
jgi:methyl-accepting chemotaxis protein